VAGSRDIRVRRRAGGRDGPTRTTEGPSCGVIRRGDAAHVGGYSWNLQDRLPVIPVPLGEGDSDVGLDLQEAFEKTYDRRGYDYILDYQAAVKPPLPEEVRRWVAERVAGT